jgi:hypothetical protein
MTEPIKLPPIPDKIVGWYTTHRPDVEAWGRLAVEQNTAELKAEVERLRADHATLLDNASIEVRRLRAESNKMEAEVERLRALYSDLIMCVGNKHPGESRHETAKRYLIHAETPVISTAVAALKEPK